MAASYPTTIKSFVTKADGEVFYASHITDLELEVVAIETALKTGPTVMASATLTTPLAASSGGTGVAAVGTSGNLLTSTGSAWASTAPAPGGLDILQVEAMS